MIVYFIPILLCLLTPFFRELADSRRWYICLGILLCLFYCFGYMTGSDWRTYEDWYNCLDFNKFYFGYRNEPGYYLYMMLFKKIGVTFWAYFIFTKSLIFIIVYKTIFEYCRESGYLSLMYFLPWFGMYLFIDNPMRNCIAVAIFLLSVRYIIEHKFWKFFGLMLLAASFHFSALVIILFYPFLNRRISTWVYVTLFIIINIIFLNRELLIGILAKLFGMIPYVQNKLITYFLFDSMFAQGKLLSFGMIWQTTLFIMILCYRERITEQIGGDKGLFVFNAAMIYFLLVRFSMTIEVFIRIQLYFSVFLSIAVGLVMLSFNYRSRILYVCLLFMVSSYICFDRTTSSARYVPYSNIVDNVIRNDYPSYSKRFWYNVKHSPYTNRVDYGDEL